MTIRRPAALVLLVAGPLFFALEVQFALGRLLTFGMPALVLLAARVTVVVIGFIAGRLLWQDDAEGWRVVRVWAVAAAVMLVLTFATPYFPSNRAPSEKRLALVVWLVVYAAWLGVATWQVRRAARDADR